MSNYRKYWWLSLTWCLATLMAACRQNLLATPDSVGQQLTFTTIQSPASAQAAFLAALTSFKDQVINVPDNGNYGLFVLSGLLSDELASQATGRQDLAENDGRYTLFSETVNGQRIGGIGGEDGDAVLQNLLYARSQLLLLIEPLVNNETGMTRSLAGEAYALAGYAELYMAEDYCPGMTLDRALPGSGIEFGTPLTTDSLLGTAIGHFDSALKLAYTNDTVINLASVGLGRAWLDRDSLSEAAQAVASVPLNFAYVLASEYSERGSVMRNLWSNQIYQSTQCCSPCVPNWNVADREGGVGMNYVSAADFRLSLDSSIETCDYILGGPSGQNGSYGLTDKAFYYPLKFGPVGQSTDIPIATGVEAALVGAEAAGGNSRTPGPMLSQLEMLRENAPQTYLQLPDTLPAFSPDSLSATGAEAIGIMFQERAFWLFGMGTRLGDMRREVRQYGSVLSPSDTSNAVNLVYPNGPYGPEQLSPSYDQAYQPFFWQNYGTDVDLPLPTPGSANGEYYVSNPAYKGCMSATTVP